jgi:alanyl-tRNA synthetase
LTSADEGFALDPKRLYVTVFKGLPAQAGENGIPRDEEAITVWTEVFSRNNISCDVCGTDEILKEGVRIIPLGVDDNFWIAGATGPCGGDTEIFYDVSPELGSLTGKFSDLVKAGRIIEIWNNVFMEFNKTADGQYEPLTNKNVDTGMGLERTTAVLNGKAHVFATDLFIPLLSKIKSLAKIEDEKAERIIADHVKTAVFMLADGILPANTEQGYVLRRLLRRAIRFIDKLGMPNDALAYVAEEVVKMYVEAYPEVKAKEDDIKKELMAEDFKFRTTLEKGIKEFSKFADKNISGHDAFILFSTYGFPLELTLELAQERNVTVDVIAFAEEMKKHQELSRAGAEQKFKGGLAGTGEIETRYHTATHLLNAALRKVLGDHIYQKGSNITAERMRFDFSHPEKMTDEQKKQVEDLVNESINKEYPVTLAQMSVQDAKDQGAIGVFTDKYDEVVKVYTVGNDSETFSKEICGGPHVENTKILGHFKIMKEEAVSAGVRRIKAVLM